MRLTPKYVSLSNKSISVFLKTKTHFSLFRFFQEEPIQHDFSGVTEFVLKGHGFLGKYLLS